MKPVQRFQYSESLKCFCSSSTYVDICIPLMSVQSISLCRGSEVYYGKIVQPFRQVMQIEAISAPIWGYRLDWYGQDIAIMISIGIVGIGL